MHNYAFLQYQPGAYYVPIETESQQLIPHLAAFHEIGGRGANLTRPLKSTILPALVAQSDAVQRALAANTIVWTPKGWVGDNTDVLALASYIPPAQHSRALVIGNGGAARASWVALVDRGYEVHVMARDPKRVWPEAIGLGWDLAQLCEGYSVIVNATPLGQAGEPGWDLTELPNLTSGTIVVDWVYSPRLTPFLHWAMAQPETMIVDGLSLLVAQARWAWNLWFGQPAPNGVLEEAIAWQPLS